MSDPGRTQGTTGPGAEAPPSVWVVIVSYNSYRDSRDCLYSLSAASWPNLRVVLVDNGSTDGSGERLREEFPEALHIRSGENRGFAGGCNIGIEAALDGDADYICLLNNDTIVEAGFIEPLVGRARQDPGAGIIGGKILYDEPGDIIWFAGGIIDPRSGHTSHRGQDEPDTGRYDIAVDVDYITGCLFFVSADLYRRLGTLDERFFMYAEEVDFCLRVCRAGFRCVYEPAAVIRHRVSRSMGGAYQPRFYYYQTRNLLEAYRKDAGVGRLAALVKLPWFSLVPRRSLTLLRAHRARSWPYIAALWSGFIAFLGGRFGPAETPGGGGRS